VAPDDERKARAASELDVPHYFALTIREAFLYRLLCVIYHRRERKFARAVARELEEHTDGPLSDLARGHLLGILEGLHWSKAISEHMHLLLQIRIQDRKDWSKSTM